MNTIIFIPARSGSKTIPHKNIKLLGGKPLLAWTIETAFKSGLGRVIVSSDSEEYLKIAKEYGAETLSRPSELAGDEVSMYEVLKNEIHKIEPVPEAVILLPPTSPFRNAVQVKAAMSFFENNLDKYDSLMSVQQVPGKFNPAQVLVTTSSGVRMANGSPLSNRITRRQEYPNAYVTAGGIYIFKTSNLAQGSFYGKETMLMECESSVDINNDDDFLEAEKYYEKNFVKRPQE